ncbi:hypothetical protein GCM10011390_19830 [Aureimonas endophytica]|uniref:Uncharacterized protein n=1 Tax=Aureimonas endophytica TaxID=2027858 RepID=A0A916ZKI4_9HYPH|nr:hypothetical protein GCM10011390_19830 [Aureimonas endophytica]
MAAAHFSGLAARIEHGEPFSAETLARRIPTAWTALDRVCSDAVGRAAITLALRDMNDRNPAADFEGWSTALGGTEALLRRMAACSPSDGNVWARLALIERVIVMPMPVIVATMRLSEKLSPAEYGPLLARLEVARLADPALAAATAEITDRDLDRFLAQAPAYQSLDSLRWLRAQPRFDFDRRVAALPPERYDTFKRAGVFDEAKKDEGDPKLFQLPEAPPPWLGP